ncbi:hypothetical protein [Halobacterium salinarum]|uniref:hypothetical protein n=1 Tax=Halobacterium salinarum TaxID=2242 RepID=UPI002554E5CC|nr:hypothetical protein [Halobacterium salinarum]MDL0133578.1 hypothetical protein [Halobacterium salinarum]
MTDDEFQISEEPPRDEEGHPTHPEKDYRICGAVKSDRTTPTDHGRERDEFDYCLLAAGWGTDRDVGPCQKHPVSGEQWGESNPNYSHGGYSGLEEFDDYMMKPAPEDHRAALESVDFDDDGKAYAATMVRRLTHEFRITGDPRKAAEARQWASEFGLIEAAPDKLEIDTDLDLTPEEKEQLDETFDDEPQT